MCMGVPVRLISVDGIAGMAEGPQGIDLIDLSLCPEAVAGDWLLNFLGAARGVITADEAEKITAALQGLRDLMDGGDLGAAFADLDGRTPSLPPHLQAALDAGRSHG
ncbi:MAG: HypC/HybG/HupF family hydrogenase formation chaperone [Paracoccaceae bacterium]|nr:HypC/HybG/HupF family hydrogenase formation chaperone [Paracoccaceae bacterium]